MSAQVIYDMPPAVYFADADGPRLSQSLATICVQKSPLHAWQAHPKLGGKDQWKYEPSTDDGSIVHALVLGSDEIHKMQATTETGEPVTEFRTKAAREERDAALGRGQIPLTHEKLGVYEYKAKALRSRLAERNVWTPGSIERDDACSSTEVVIYWEEQTPHGPVRCRCRIDDLTVIENSALIVDLKTTRDAHSRSLRRAIWDYGYDIQHAACVRAVEAAFPHMAGRVEMVFGFCEIEKPYAVNPLTLSGEYRRLGEARWERGRDAWARALATGDWRGYEGGSVEPPAWVLAQEMGET